jgi:hypothetical protein
MNLKDNSYKLMAGGVADLNKASSLMASGNYSGARGPYLSGADKILSVKQGADLAMSSEGMALGDDMANLRDSVRDAANGSPVARQILRDAGFSV